MYKFTLVDGTKVNFSGLNGTNFITLNKERMDTSVFTDKNLETVTIEDDDGNVETYHNLSLIQEQQQLDGNYYICFREKSDEEIANDERDEYITLLESALVAVYEQKEKDEAIVGIYTDLVRKNIEDVDNVPDDIKEEVKKSIYDDGDSGFKDK